MSGYKSAKPSQSAIWPYLIKTTCIPYDTVLSHGIYLEWWFLYWTYLHLGWDNPLYVTINTMKDIEHLWSPALKLVVLLPVIWHVTHSHTFPSTFWGLRGTVSHPRWDVLFHIQKVFHIQKEIFTRLFLSALFIMVKTGE